MSVGRFTSYNILGSVVPLILTFVTVPIYIHLVGIDRVGVLSVAWLLLGYFGLFDLGLGKATAFRMAAQRDAAAEDRAATLWGALIVNVGMGLIGGALLWVAGHIYFAHYFKVAETLRPEILAAVPLLALSVPVATLTGVLTGALQGREKFLETNVNSRRHIHHNAVSATARDNNAAARSPPSIGPRTSATPSGSSWNRIVVTAEITLVSRKFSRP